MEGGDMSFLAALAAQESAAQQKASGAEDTSMDGPPSSKPEDPPAMDSKEDRGEKIKIEEEQEPKIKQEEDAEDNNAGDDNAGDQEEEEEEDPILHLGGRIEKKAYCLLDGIFENKDGTKQRVTIPLTRLPAVLGRSHSTGDINFFSLGPAKALSRQHCVIDYRDPLGGKLCTPKSALKDTDEEGNLEYEKGKPFTVVNPQSPIKRGSGKENDFPARGAFVLEALGKNLIMVGNNRMKQGEIAILDSGTPIRMSSYSLYFLLPNDTPSLKTMEIPIEDTKSPPSPKQVMSGGFKRKMPGSISSPESAKPKPKKPKAAPFAQLQAELDALPIETLFQRMNEAINSDRWERKHQLIGSTISLHAVKDATSAPEIREQAADGGVARTEIMRWIKESPKYAEWVEQMNSKMESKSYQNTITKALLKAGNVRTGSGGRYIKWILPGVKLNTGTEGGGEKADKSQKTDASKEDGGDDEEEEGEDDEEGVDDDDDDNEDEDEGGDNDGEDENDDGAEGDHDGDEEKMSASGVASSSAERREEPDGEKSVGAGGESFEANLGEEAASENEDDNEESRNHAPDP